MESASGHKPAIVVAARHEHRTRALADRRDRGRAAGSARVERAALHAIDEQDRRIHRQPEQRDDADERVDARADTGEHERPGRAEDRQRHGESTSSGIVNDSNVIASTA